MDMWLNIGTLVTIVEIAKEYDNGEMDIITKGTMYSEFWRS